MSCDSLSKFLAPIRYCSVDTELIMMRSSSSAVASSAILCIDAIPPPVLSRAPRKEALVPLNTRCRSLEN